MDLEKFSDEQVALQLQDCLKEDAPKRAVLKAVYEELYKRFYTRSFYLSRYYGLSHNDAEDAVQEAFLNLYRGIRTYQTGRPFKPWFFRIVYNEIRNKYNELRRKRYQDLDLYQDLPSGEGDEKNIIEKLQFRALLQGITEKLPERLRKVLLFKIYGDMSLKEIAAASGVSERQVTNRLNRAYHLIKGRLGKLS